MRIYILPQITLYNYHRYREKLAKNITNTSIFEDKFSVTSSSVVKNFEIGSHHLSFSNVQMIKIVKDFLRAICHCDVTQSLCCCQVHNSTSDLEISDHVIFDILMQYIWND